MSNRVFTFGLVVVVSVLVASCSGQDGRGGFGAPSQGPGEFAHVKSQSGISGNFALDAKGCWYGDLKDGSRLVVFPAEFAQNPDNGSELVSPDGVVYQSGDEFDASGTVIPMDLVPGGTDGKWRSYLSFCSPTAQEVIVLNTVDKGTNPGSLTAAEVEEMVRRASFTEHWPCGRGWTVATADQRVAIVVHQATDEPLGTLESIDLPDARWTAEVVVGKQLMSKHCDDAIETWVALPTITERFPITAGTITILDPLPERNAPPTSVTARLDRGLVDTGSKSIELPTTRLFNTDFNLFVG